jgi:hypothetical protein
MVTPLTERRDISVTLGNLRSCGGAAFPRDVHGCLLNPPGTVSLSLGYLRVHGSYGSPGVSQCLVNVGEAGLGLVFPGVFRSEVLGELADDRLPRHPLDGGKGGVERLSDTGHGGCSPV